MKTVGIIAEFNPFHNGHAHLLKEARALTGAEVVVVVMSGNYVQRGTPALLSKYARARMALSCGADLVIELPLFTSCGSAEYFAEGAVRLLEDLQVDALCFGSEAGELTSLQPLARLLAEEPTEYRCLLKKELASGSNFPTARRNAVAALLPECAPFLDQPNNLLGIEYLKAIEKRGSKLAVQTIPRAGAGYHESGLSDSAYPSATAIRNFFCQEAMPGSLISLADYMPQPALTILEQEFFRTFPVTENDYSDLLSYTLLTRSKEALAEIADMGSELAIRLRSYRYEHIRFTQLVHLLKTKELTYTRICRALLHAILNITTEDLEAFRSLPHTPYIRILGLTQAARPFLKQSHIKTLPLVMKPARAIRTLSPEVIPFWEKEIASAELYRQISYTKYHTEQPAEYTHEILILE